MRSHLLALLLASVALCPVVARADTFVFAFNGVVQPNIYAPDTYPSLSFSWQLSGPPEYFLYDDQYPAYRYPSVSLPGNPFGSVADVLVSSTDVDFLGGPIYDYGFGGLSTSKAFVSGLDSNPTFIPGTYAAEAEFFDYSIYDGSFTVTDVTTVTPEPSTLALLGSGLVGTAGVFWRKRSRGVTTGPSSGV